MAEVMAEQGLVAKVMLSTLEVMVKAVLLEHLVNQMELYTLEVEAAAERIIVEVVALEVVELVPTGMLLVLEGTEILTRVLVEAEAAAGITVALVDLA